MNVNLHINGNKVHTTNYESLVEATGHSLANCRYWKHIDMDPSLFINDDRPPSFLLYLGCNVSSPIINELLDIKSAFPDAINLLNLIDIDFHYNTYKPNLHLADLVDALNYLFGSLIVNLEFKFPFVFSFYGRKLFKTNYNWLVRNLDETLCSSPPNNPVLTHDKNRAFLQLMKNIQLKILAEYNTLNIMKECDMSSSKLDAHKKYKTRFLELGLSPPSILSIKTMVYDLQVFDLKSIEGHIDNISIT